MTDRELLEWAAKAAGIELWHEDVFTDGLTKKVSANGIIRWHPLTNDGDAFRLAVQLRFEVDVYYGEVASGDEGDRRQTLIGDDTDRCAATRRAIVRAAAEIGKDMEKQK